MEDLKKEIDEKLKNIEKMINENKDKEEIENSRKELDKLLNKYLKGYK